MPNKSRKPVFVKITFADSERGEQDVSNALDMADFPAEVEAVDVPELVAALKATRAAIRQLASTAGDVPEFNKGGFAYRANRKADAALAKF